MRSPRLAVAVAAGRGAARVSRFADYGDGTAIGGRVAMSLVPDVIARLAGDADVALVTGTNGKSTTATMLAAALGVEDPVAFNAGGSNMREGIAMALASRPASQRAVLEVDEMVLGAMARQTGAGWVVLMNASREYTRGVSLEATLRHWDAVIRDLGEGAVVVANADDPLVVSVAATTSGRVVWVAGGCSWRRDAERCRSCGGAVVWADEQDAHWSCSGCGLARPDPDWWLEGRSLVGRALPPIPLTVQLPGRWLVSNAAFAVATAVAMGVDPVVAAAAATTVGDVDGRYRSLDVSGRRSRLFLVKNPASWAEAVSLAGDGNPVVIAMESFSMRDLTPGWDVDLDSLAGTDVVATGQRRLDVSAMLEVAGVAHRVVEDPLEAILSVPEGAVHVIANYTAFKDLRRRLSG